MLETEGPPRTLSRVVGGRRLVLVPQSSRGTPRSVHDVMSEVEEEAVVPGALRTHNDESHESEFDTESIPRIDSRRRLSLIWRPDPVPVDPDVPDSSRRAMQMERQQRVEFGALGGNGWRRFAGRISMQGALFARCSQFLEGPVQVSVGHQFGGHEDRVPVR